MSFLLHFFVINLVITLSNGLHFDYIKNFSKPADYVSFAGRGSITYAITNNDIKTVHIYTTHYNIKKNQSGLARLTRVKGIEKGFGRSTKLVSHPYYPDSGTL